MKYIDLTNGSGGGSSQKKKYGADIDVLIGDISNNGMLLIPQKQADLVFTGVKSVGAQALMQKFKNANVQNVIFPDLEILGAGSAMEECFYNTSIKTLSMPKLQTLTNGYVLASAFRNTQLTSVEFPALTTIDGNYALQYCFARCLHLTSLSFPALTTVSNNVHQFTDMLQQVTGCTVHFPASMQNIIGSWEDVTNGFGGTNTIVLFDL